MSKVLVHGNNRNAFVTDLQRGGQLASVVFTAAGGVRTGHGNADDVLFPQRIHSDDRSECRIDSATQTDNNVFESTFAHVIASAEDQSGVRARFLTFD